MPTYQYKCECGFTDTYIRTISDRDRSPVCRECQSPTKRVLAFTGTVWAPTSGGHR